MRGNWGALTAMAPPEQQIGHQIGAGLGSANVHPHMNQPRQPHSPATSNTPAWNIADRIAVKEEPSEDKNNDSGVSPGHYTSNSASPRSRRSSSTANCSLSPGSATSQDSSAMQCTMFDYSPQRGFKSCTPPPLGFGHLNGGGCGSPELKLQSSRMQVSSGVKRENDDVETGMQDDTLQCPICAFTTVQRLEFNEHLTACSRSASQLSPNGTQGDDRSGHDSEDEPGLRVPRVNSLGKVKTFRCKQCNFVAITKLEFWEHSRGHIKAEKLLTCPKCPFVTEYKHHLEYHLRNHFGSKPFKCDKCSYSCVNKSMLNSHLKSHSNVYQYRCANCSYATKYCHSLKLHLRKHSHAAAIVLNPDGSPNPLPIIDVYGTRRGPKQKYHQKTNESQQLPSPPPQQQQQQQQNPNPSPSPTQIPIPIPIPAAMSALLRANTTFQSAIVSSQMVQPPLTVPFPYSQIYNNFLQFSDNNNEKKQDNLKTGMLCGYGTTFNGDKIEAVQECEQTSSSPSPKPSGDGSMEESMTIEGDSKASPLDLSKPEMPSQAKSLGTSRRKGRAFKLDRLVVEQDSDDEPMTPSPPRFNLLHHLQESYGKTECNAETAEGNTEYNCQYCDIAFGNVVMYTMHMGYHGYKNPYTCNLCGQQCTDKISFFLHIARSSHS